jgi:hypothetical protein
MPKDKKQGLLQTPFVVNSLTFTLLPFPVYLPEYHAVLVDAAEAGALQELWFLHHCTNSTVEIKMVHQGPGNHLQQLLPHFPKLTH